ncbi:YkgJ family cysteine cluster protein [Halorubrum sp. JWXQ-INN 858]|uniref:YkgJ family cysteine cluster protein n=1 Tax=Halorubrum sp. JWXQ-INN 858 TaxID=2690782 RepID=UPI00135A005D|nr:YkgJ family cysteine cluster protein [Halorubrum sp. JWXQ-INN 858]MWV63569.1 YkgJ family cysteine cluster protein [Halorubrum sp. JWXQ-INN 858]
MELDCEGCAGCCVDWRPLRPDDDAVDGAAARRAGRRPPLDDVDGLVPLSRDEVAAFLGDGLGDVLVPRLFEPAEGDDRREIDGIDVAAAGGRPVFMVGLRKPPKPVAPVGTDTPRWLDACVFLDPTTLQCRIHGSDRYPETCAVYPGHNLALGAETACERVTAAGGGERLLDDAVPEGTPPPAFGPHALGATVFAYPDPNDLSGVVGRLRAGETTAADRARFVGAAVGSRPGSLTVDRERMATAERRARDADSWAGRAVDEWKTRAGADGETVPLDPPVRERLVRELEDDAGAPATPGWE